MDRLYQNSVVRVAMRRWRCWPCVLLLFSVVGCAFGPKALELSHGKFNHSFRRVMDEQLLLNLVRLRYNENPAQIDVASIAAQYELSGAIEARPFFSTEAANLVNVADSFRDFSQILPFIGGSATNRPTLSLTPLDDSDNIRQLLAPLTLDDIAFLAETSWPVATVFRLCVGSMNQLPNARCAAGPDTGVMCEFREFQRVTEIMQELQDSGDLRFSREEKLVDVGTPLAENAVTATNHVEAAKSGLEYRQNEDKTWSLIRRDRRLALLINPSRIHDPQVGEFCRLLNVVPGQSRYEIVIAGTNDIFPSAGPPQHRAIAITPRSMIQTLFYASYGVNIPQKHLNCDLVRPTLTPDGLVFDWQELMRGLLTIHTSCDHYQPKCAAIAVRYRDVWYYIDDRDATSKATFTLISIMTRLNLIGARKGGPTLTLPVGR